VSADLIETYCGAIYPRHSQTRKSCPLPAEIVERGRKLVRAYDLQT
jgi:hypothetical protein